MRRFFALVAVFLVVCTCLWSRRVPAEQALGYARNFWLQKDGPRTAVLQQVQTEFTNIYLFVDTGGRGFVMLAADDRSLPVLGYSLENNFVVADMPAHVHGWLQDYNDQIQWLIDNNIEKTNEINAQWQDLNNTRSQLPQTWSTSVQPLVKTMWDQDYPYYNLCPTIGSTHCVTGCVATAMAQIMKFWNHPTSGIGSNSYTWNSTTLSADFANTTYDWKNMKNSYNSSNDTQKTAVATLMYHVGVACKMSYGTSASSALTTASSYEDAAAVNAYKKYFKYKWTATSVYFDNYSDEDWKLLLQNELYNGRPIQYSGRSNSGGHSFVCDGYDTNEKFHINWGWGGYCDAYYAIGQLNPAPGGIGGNSNSSYNIKNQAVIGIEPEHSTGGQVQFNVSANDASLGSVSGGGTFTIFEDTVTLVPTPADGCAFVNWSNESNEVPLQFLASGNSTTIVANFKRLGGDTLNYCKDAHNTSYNLTGTTNLWGIRIPKANLTAGNLLTDVMFYSADDGTYTVRIYFGNIFFESNPTEAYSQTFNVADSGKWVTLHLSNPLELSASEDLCVALECSGVSFPCAISTSAASINGSYFYYSYYSLWYYVTENTNDDYMTWMIKAITAPPHKITMDASKVTITSTTKGLNLSETNLASSNKNAEITYSIDTSSPNNIATIVDNKLTATGTGKIKIKATATDATFGVAENTVDLTVGRGTLVFDGAQNDQDWSNAGNWKPHYSVLPNAKDFDVQIDVACTIPANAVADCHDLSLGTSGVLTVASKAVLNVEDTLNNDNADKLIIKADATGSGSVLFGSGAPKATVEMYMKGTTDANGKNPDWQLRGSIVGNDFALKNPDEWANIRVYQWDETQNANTETGCWTNKKVGSEISLQPWVGYGFANYSTTPVTVKYTGTLINGSQGWLLSRTGSGRPNVGNNMLTNSYSAPITISEIAFDGAYASVIFYNTGSWSDWSEHKDSLYDEGNSKGQMLVCPSATSSAAQHPTTIPAGQSFYVLAYAHNAAVNVDYTDVANSINNPMLMPSAQNDFNVLAVTISGRKGSDRAVLIECGNCDDGYNDGYDGMKYPGDAGIPQLYAVNVFGKTSVNASNTILGQKMGVTSSEAGELLKMVFETDRLGGFAQLTLHDFVTGRFVNILGGEEYEFTTTGNDGERFEIVGFRMQEDDQNDSEIRVYGNRLFVGDTEGMVKIYDMSGKIVWQDDVRSNEWLELPELLHGVYVVKTENTTVKIII